MLGIEPQIVHIPSELLRVADPDLFTHLDVEKSFPGLFDNAKIRSAVPDFCCDISLHDGLRMMVDWFEREAKHVDPVKDAMEDKLVELHAGWVDQMQGLSKSK